MSKKETEFDRIERMKKRDKEAEITRRKNADQSNEKKKKISKPRNNQNGWEDDYDLDY